MSFIQSIKRTTDRFAKWYPGPLIIALALVVLFVSLVLYLSNPITELECKVGAIFYHYDVENWCHQLTTLYQVDFQFEYKNSLKSYNIYGYCEPNTTAACKTEVENYYPIGSIWTCYHDRRLPYYSDQISGFEEPSLFREMTIAAETLFYLGLALVGFSLIVYCYLLHWRWQEKRARERAIQTNSAGPYNNLEVGPQV